MMWHDVAHCLPQRSPLTARGQLSVLLSHTCSSLLVDRFQQQSGWTGSALCLITDGVVTGTFQDYRSLVHAISYDVCLL